MQIIGKDVNIKSESDVFYLYVIGDSHIGAHNCSEGHLRSYVDYIKKKPNCFWIGGGDYCNCITPSDVNRYDVRALADWLFLGEAMNIKEALMDIAKQERERFCEIVEPIRKKCIGLIEGNHEYTIMKRSHNGHHYVMCDELGVPNLTDVGFVRIIFRRATTKTGKTKGKSIVILIAHGMGGGRTPGAEPNHLMRLGQSFEADILLRGHSHTFRIEPPDPCLYIPRTGALPDECLQRTMHKANWGCWLKSYAAGPSTYDSRANYPARPLQSLEIKIKPLVGQRVSYGGRSVSQTRHKITITECPYEFE